MLRLNFPTHITELLFLPNCDPTYNFVNKVKKVDNSMFTNEKRTT